MPGRRLAFRCLGLNDNQHLVAPLETEPFNYAMVFDLGIYSFHCGLYDEAIRQLRRSLELRPGVPMAEEALTWSYSMLGRHDEAVALLGEIDDRLDGEFDPSVLASGTFVNARAGREAEARVALEKLRRPPEGVEIDSSWLAMACASVGELECALDHLEGAYRQRSSALVFLQTAPVFDPLRELPRFQALLERMAFPG